jgi:hypothetical protein
MAVESSVGVRITIWRPYTPERQLAFQLESNEPLMLVRPEMQLQQEAFAWQVREDVWGGVTDADRRLELSQRTIADFEPILPPSQRSMEKFRQLLDAVSAAIENTEWSDSAQQLDEDDADTPYKLNALLCFHLQMRWIYDVFKDTPGASVSVR